MTTIIENILPQEMIDSILHLSEVIKAKTHIDNLSYGSISFTIPLSSSIKTELHRHFGLDLSSVHTIPMRWIKGDTQSHIDKGSSTFVNTYLVYLTDSTGEFIIDESSYSIMKGYGYMFSEGLSHETINTGFEPRLLLGPMSEKGTVVGSGISGPGGSTIYFRQTTDLQYSTDNQENWINIGNNYPLYIYNYDTSLGVLQIEFVSNITLDDVDLAGQYKYFICGSSHIQFGSKILKDDGTRPVITIDVDSYIGLIENGTNSIPGNNYIYVYNLIIEASAHEIENGGGWFGRSYFGNGATNNYFINCSSSGNLSPGITGSGAIVGAYAGLGGQLYITGCSSSGIIEQNDGGIVGGFAGGNGGSVICEQCWSTGIIESRGGGIFGYYAGDDGTVEAIKCYSTGNIGIESGGIFGPYAGNFGQALAEKCYTTGNIGANGGGIFSKGAGSNSGSSSAINCYSAGTIDTPGNGIYGYEKVNGTEINCYAANNNWNNDTANLSLLGVPSLSNIVGDTWVYKGINTPYELNEIGYTPYSLTIISSSPNLIQLYNQTIQTGQTTNTAIISDASGNNFEILEINNGNESSYGTITINSQTGAISTTSSTLGGTYNIIIRSVGSYNITIFNLIINGVSQITSFGSIAPCCLVNNPNPNPQSTDYDSNVITMKHSSKAVDVSVDTFYRGVATGQRTAHSQPIFKSYHDYILFLQGKLR